MTDEFPEVGDRVRITKIRRGRSCPEELHEAFDKVEGRILEIKEREQNSVEDIAIGCRPYRYEFWIAHLTGWVKSNSQSHMESVYLDDTEFELVSKKKSKNDKENNE